MRALSYIFGNDIHPTVRTRVLIAFSAFVLMIGVALVSELQFASKPLQVRELAGRDVSMEKLADIFLGMDQMSLYGHYMSIALTVIVIFLGAILLLTAIRESPKK
jgi:hypothetical protein